MRFFTILILFSTFGLLGCQQTPYNDDTPYIESFDIVDSYNVNTEFDGHIRPTINPFIDAGFFEIFWTVDSRHAYEVNFYINDRPQLNRALLVSSNMCGPGYSCDKRAYQHCFYTEDFHIDCEAPNSAGIVDSVNISELIYSLPENVYFIIEVCDDLGLFCDIDSRLVTVE